MSALAASRGAAYELVSRARCAEGQVRRTASIAGSVKTRSPMRSFRTSRIRRRCSGLCIVVSVLRLVERTDWSSSHAALQFGGTVLLRIGLCLRMFQFPQANLFDER